MKDKLEKELKEAREQEQRKLKELDREIKEKLERELRQAREEEQRKLQELEEKIKRQEAEFRKQQVANLSR